jgi:uncharacterized protein YaiL (DUF2058 family)
MMEKIYVFDGVKKRLATTEEIAQFEKDQAEQLERKRLLEASEKEKQQKRESAVAKLKALGLTDDEVDALLGN